MQYEPTEAELNGLSGDERAADEATATFYAQQEVEREEWERQAHHHEEAAQAWEPGEYEAMLAEVEGY